MSTNPGFAGQARYRIAFRAVGAVVLVAGIAMFVYGVTSVFGSGGASDFGSDGPSGLQNVCFVGGLPVVGVGLMCLQAGFLGAAARYGAGETMPVVKDSAAYLTDGEGLLGVGRTVDDRPASSAASGPYCRQCGVRNDGDAKFCDSCGSALG